MSKNMLPRTCRSCGCTFIGGPRAWYCPECRAERAKVASKRCKEKMKTPNYIPLGSTIKCEICGKNIIKTGGGTRFCYECGAKHLKEIDNKQSLEWKYNNKDKIKEGKRKLSKKRRAEEGKISGIKYIIWDKEKRKWRVVPIINKKQVHLGYFDELSDAKTALDDFLNNA